MNKDPNNPLPDWFAAPEPRVAAAVATNPPRPRRRILPIIIVIACVAIVISGVVAYIAFINQQRINYFSDFHAAYIKLETGLIGFSDITEPDDLAASDDIAMTWKQYVEALNTFTTTPLYKENPQLVDEISAKSLTYEAYTTRVIPAMLQYLTNCYITGDATMVSSTCRSYVQTAVDAGDPLSKTLATELLSVIDSASKNAFLTESQTDTIHDLEVKIFAIGSTIADSVGSKVVSLGQALRITIVNDGN